MSLIDQRNDQKKKKPTFIRQDAHKVKRLGKVWRKPKGHQSKMRLGKKSYSKTVKVGYGSPKAVKGMTRDGLVPVDVANIADLAKVQKGMVGVIKASVGNRKRAMIIKAAIEKKVALINGTQERVTLIEKSLQERQDAKKAKSAKKADADKESKEEVKEEKKDDESKEALTDEEEKEADKKEKDKLLIKKGAI